MTKISHHIAPYDNYNTHIELLYFEGCNEIPLKPSQKFYATSKIMVNSLKFSLSFIYIPIHTTNDYGFQFPFILL